MEPYLGEIRLFAGTYAPRGWAFCDGRQLSVSEYATLFSLLGTTYGGDGVTKFQLPKIQNRVVVGTGQFFNGDNYVLGGTGGQSTVALRAANVPTHSHSLIGCQINATTAEPSGKSVLANSVPDGSTGGYTSVKFYASLPTGTLKPDSPLNPNVVQPAGNSTPHNNMMPYLTMNYIIALTGLYP